MLDGRVRNVIIALVAGGAIASAGSIYGRHQAQPPVLITGAQPASPDPADGIPSTTAPPPPSSIPPVTGDNGSTPPGPAVEAQTALASSTKPEPIYVHVAGAVKHPDLYALPPGTRVAGAIKAAGGPTADADIDAINLAEKVVDGEKVYIPRKGETSAPGESAGNTIGLASSTPTDSAPADTTPTTTPVVESHSHSSSSRGHSNKLTDPSEGKVNINTASVEDLERLPGVGPATAARIVAYRKENGGFKSPEDLMDVGGIGEKKMAKLAPFVVVR